MGQRVNINLIVGLALVVIGGLFLLDNFDIIYFDMPLWIFRWQSILIIIGLILLVNSKNNTAGYVLITIGVIGWYPEIWPVILIIIGFYILYRRREHTPRTDNKIDSSQPSESSQDDYLNDVAIFGGGKKIITSENFRGGKITAIFGGSEIDIYGSKLAEGTHVLDVFAMFGGTDILMHPEWNVKIDVVPIFGGFTDKRRKDADHVPDPERKLIIKGLVLFGGGNLKS